MKISIKVMCACGDEVDEVTMESQDKTFQILKSVDKTLYEILLLLQYKFDLLGSDEEDRLAEPERWKPEEGKQYWFITTD